MIKRKSIYNSILVTSSLSLLIAGCFGGSDHKKDEVASAPLTAISSDAEAQAAASAATDTDAMNNLGDTVDLGGMMDDFSYMLGTSFKAPNGSLKFSGHAESTKAMKKLEKLLKPAAAKLVHAKTLASGYGALAAQELPCPNGGTMTLDSNVDANGMSGSASLVYKDCREDFGSYYEITNGKINMSGNGSDTSYSVTLSIGDGNGTANNAANSSDLRTNTYDLTDAVIGWDVTSGNLKINFSVNNDSSGSPESYSSKISGSLANDSLVETTRETVSVRDFVADSKEGLTLTTFWDTDTKFDGVFETDVDSGNDGTVDENTYIGFNNLHVVIKYTSMSANSFNWGDYTTDINGKVVVEHTPGPVCGDGSYQIVTNTSFTHVNYVLTAGKMTINNSTVVEVAADGSLNITLNGGTPTNMTEDGLAGICLL